MVRAWIMDNDSCNQRQPHMTDPPQFIDLDGLKKIGVLYWKIDADNYEKEGLLQKIRDERGYKYSDCITCCPDKLPDYENKLTIFFTEHLHSDEEIRFIMEGSGYFDVRNPEDKWIRIECVKGDMIVIPAGIYHRFTLDTNDHMKTMRLFVGEPVWTPINRPADDHPKRQEYLQSLRQAQTA
ncbi:hypothetical protein CHS0354_001714 [Potamilus streckersoni]|uniref:Acireductone dioxygenase n=1 Tax=Potamilus streckersoni TaxID=2493646 RepID=A0AAE0S308_9BIVA|nr:hypothetical protein CHS0354_001714 [Potamilus streckersoni]